MSNDGGRVDEPTSYELRPPDAPRVPPPDAGPGDATGYPPTQAVRAPRAPAPVPGPASPVAPAPAADPAARRALGGRYRLVSRLGHGGMGTVWLAHDEVVDRDVAIKEPRVPDNVGERDRERVYLRMQREARAAARIEHPAVVTMHDVVIEDAKPWIVMELVRGQSLADRLQEGTLDPREAARIGLAVLDALTAAHEKGVLHRDVKPDNVLLGRGDRVVLSDFGIAQVEGEQGLTETGAFVGSPEFIAPERVLGRQPGPESDLWSLGVVLYAAVEGMSPYRRSNVPATLQAVLSAEPQMPARGSGAFGTLVMRLLGKDPAARPDAAEIRAVLESVARPPATTRPYSDARPEPAATGLGGWVPPVLRQSRPARYGLGAGVLAVAVALVLLLANPFGGGGLPEGWGIRPENEILRAKVGVPDDYRREQLTDDTGVTYNDPSGVFRIFFERKQKLPDDDLPEPKADAWTTHYERGGDNGTEIKDAKVTSKDVEHQGKRGFELVVDHTDYSDSDDFPVRYRWHELIIPGADGTYLRLRVSMPAQGAAVKDGEELYATVAGHLDLGES
ncbi:putative serine/threonine protein kinase [Streptomyces sp. L-9-10]|uniref:serine/threonine-protein kinase n=1 Tax=Streptomyces sp. L-9-10 TaxID=1478131 RepID=UPI00101CD3B4|nr:serine/threonine-protein kinase [Streptomyces sp. L-9-10]RYJ24970.1 putative serine/threonine protein kinase [Streptomyces sp. L-9-10]